jgi:hypothetical protein
VSLQSTTERIMGNRYFAIVAIFIVVALIIFIVFVETGSQLILASALAYASCFLLSIYFLRNRMTSIFDILLTSAATTFSGIWLYEIMYHYFSAMSFGTLKYDFSNLSIALYPGWAFPVYFAIAIIFVPFLKRQYMTVNKPLVAIFTLSIVLFALWAYMGYPQYSGTGDPSLLGYWMGSLTYILAIVPAFLFCGIGKINPRRRDNNKEGNFG